MGTLDKNKIGELETDKPNPKDLPQFTFFEQLRMKLLVNLGYLIVRTMAITYRTKIHGMENIRQKIESGEGFLFLIWHGRVLISLHSLKGTPIHAMVSLSKDGEHQVHFFKKFGWLSIRGSTGRGGARVLVHAARLLKGGKIVGITPDGPRGPERKVQQGTAFIAQKTKCWVLPVGTAANPAWHLKTWDHYLLPKPFARCAFYCGEPLQIDPDNFSSVEEVADFLGQAIDKATEEAERLVS